MCLECGYYNGRQVMELEAQKAKRTLRMKEKRERVGVEAGALGPETTETVEPVSDEDTSKEAKEENLQDKKPNRRDDE